ncbi:UNVERIFIED_CONTAM: KH domain-containing protein, partial [Sesamum radiatum]
VPIYPATGLYPSVDPINPARPVPSILGPSHAPDIPGYADAGTTWPVYSSALPVVSGYGGASRTEELFIKVLCPSNKIGRVIGKGGSSIKSIRQDSGARVEVEDRKSNHNECVITVISTESSDDLKSMAVEAVLLLQAKINDDDDDTVTMRLLVPSKVIGCIIGKSGSIINEIRKRTKADIRISKGEKPKCSNENDELVEIFGQVGSVRDALIQIVLRLRDDVLKDREDVRNSSAGVEPLYTGGASLPMSSVLRSVSSNAALGYDQRVDTGSGLGLLSSSGYGYGSLSMGDNGYGSLSSHSSSLYAGLPPPSTLEMVIPAHAVGKVMGKGGTNIDNIPTHISVRLLALVEMPKGTPILYSEINSMVNLPIKFILLDLGCLEMLVVGDYLNLTFLVISGAAIEISDSKSSRGDRVALVSGTTEQKRAAENLIQAFIMAT